MFKVDSKRIITTLFISFLFILAFAVNVYSQSCYAGISLDYENYIDRDGTQLVSLPVYIGFDCAIGGILIDFSTEPFCALEPVDIDTTGSIISYWELLDVTRHRNDQKMRFTGFADFPDEEDTPPLQPQTGLLFNLVLRFGCGYDENVMVDVMMDSVVISDSTGYVLFSDVSISNSTVYVGEEVTPIERGDANCDGLRVGSDVTYLVNYFRGLLLNCPCSLCGGDANNDDMIIGSDVTYLVNYFRGLTPGLESCD